MGNYYYLKLQAAVEPSFFRQSDGYALEEGPVQRFLKVHGFTEGKKGARCANFLPLETFYLPLTLLLRRRCTFGERVTR